jgi:hypothetical protein
VRLGPLERANLNQWWLGEGRETPALLGLLDRAILNHWSGFWKKPKTEAISSVIHQRRNLFDYAGFLLLIGIKSKESIKSD